MMTITPCEEIRKTMDITQEDFEEGLWELEAAGIVMIQQLARGMFAVAFSPAFLKEMAGL
jgi:hypothetical protein